ncbi:MAG: LysM peptidoglycan-binding domain-containing protein, partial [Anaerolineales bacterium]|nr:LysM peptidoglycan-binding domain-containing protein [Anaerolineales bacterium]
LNPPTPLPGTFTPAPRLEPLTPLPTYVGTPTANPTAPQTEAQAATITHVVSGGETLGYIAQLYGSSIEELSTLNGLDESDFISVGQVLLVPGSSENYGPDFKLLPDSEVVYGPSLQDFNVRDFLAQFNGYLLTYGEEVEGQFLEGPEILALVARRFSVSPRVLLALLEHRTGWVTGQGVADAGFALGFTRAGTPGTLYFQLAAAANELNWGYYGHSEGGISSFLLGDGNRLAFAPGINSGTAGAQNMLGAHDSSTLAGWQADAGPDGFFATFNWMFGSPFAYTVDPLWPTGLTQPELALPWPRGQTWYFTGGPHGGWAGGSAWAALDFVPAGDQLGCYDSDDWITAMAPGLVVYSDFGGVVVDLDGDGFTGTGWVITYMHLATRDRIPAGTYVNTGDALGHPSCEGGFSNGTHVHITRTYNGRWVAADGPIPFAMGGWLSQGLGGEYDGLLIKGDESREACECREELNAITNE